MDKNEFEKQRKKILDKYRQRKHRILHPNMDEEKDGFAQAFDLKSMLKDLEEEKKRELAVLHRKFHGLDADAFDGEFQKYERELREVNGDTDLFYRKHGFNGNPHKKSEYVKLDDKGNITHDSNICLECGKRLIDGKCSICDKKRDDWLIVG